MIIDREKYKLFKAPAELSGVSVPAGRLLDLGGKTIKTTKPITLGKGSAICNGRIEFFPPDDRKKLAEGAIHAPDASTDCKIEGITAKTGSYSGLAKVWGDRTRIHDCKVEPGSGWGILCLEGDGSHFSKIVTDQLRRGGIYLGDDGVPANGINCDNIIIEDCYLDGADEEAVFRSNTGVNCIVRRNVFINNTSKSGKEAVQLRGISGLFDDNVTIGSIAAGQTPVGQYQTSTWTIQSCTTFGYCRIEAGGNLTLDGGSLTLSPVFKWLGDTYTLVTGGGGYGIAPQPAARDLPAAKATVKGTKIIAPKMGERITYLDGATVNGKVMK